MKAIVLYSGGRDSSFVAVLLGSLGYDVKLVTANAGIVKDSWKTAAKSAKILGFPHEIFKVEKYLYEKAAKIAEQDKFPLNAIKHIHWGVIQQIAKKYHKTHTTIADGTRRDDRTPRLTYKEMQSLEDKYNISYIAPLLGFGHKAVNHLTGLLFEYDKVWTGKKPTAEYETELRALLEKKRKGLVEEIFPKKHFHSVVTGLRSRQ